MRRNYRQLVWDEGFLRIGMAYVRRYHVTAGFNLEMLATNRQDRTHLSNVYHVLVRLRRAPRLEQISPERKQEIWNETLKYCAELKDRAERIKFAQGYYVLTEALACDKRFAPGLDSLGVHPFLLMAPLHR